MPVPTNARCAWLTQSSGTRPTEDWTKRLRRCRRTELGDASAAKGKIWQLEIATDACIPSSGKTPNLGVSGRNRTRWLLRDVARQVMQRPHALPDAQPAIAIRASLCARKAEDVMEVSSGVECKCEDRSKPQLAVVCPTRWKDRTFLVFVRLV